MTIRIELLTKIVRGRTEMLIPLLSYLPEAQIEVLTQPEYCRAGAGGRVLE